MGSRERGARVSGTQIYDWLYVKRVNDFAEMTNLSKELRTKLEQEFSFVTLTEITKLESKDGTVKFLFGLHDDHAIETVIMRHNYGNSICVTTQVGAASDVRSAHPHWVA